MAVSHSHRQARVAWWPRDLQGGLEYTIVGRDVNLNEVPQSVWWAAQEALVASGVTPPVRPFRAQRSGNDFAVHMWVMNPASGWKWVRIVMILSLRS